MAKTATTIITKSKTVTKVKTKVNFTRNLTDYYWIGAFYAILYAVGHYIHPTKTTKSESEDIFTVLNVLYLPSSFPPVTVYFVYWILGTVALSGLTAATWSVIKYFDPNVPTSFFKEQMKAITVNMPLLSMMETLWAYLTVERWTKITIHDALSIQSVSLQVFGWMLMFELTWYTQHRLMHDNKVLWKYGHQYHHSWKRPEHMIGITNFAFDHVVEVWVTMSSSFVSVFFFPVNFYVKNGIGLMYMILAVLVHWDGFPFRYHLNHHYKVVKNYGSHVPVFDIFFGTYHWG